LVLEMGDTLEEAPPVDTLDRLFARGLALPTLILQLDKAAVDERIVAVLLHIRSLQAGYASLQEVRDAVLRFRETGKPVIALLDMATLNATRELYLASSADKVYLVPGFLGPFAGIAGHFLYLGGFLGKLGIEVEYERIGPYKSAPETFSARQMSPPARRMFNELLDGIFSQVVRGIAQGRSLETASVRRLVEQAPSVLEEYLAAGLADGSADRDEVLEREGFGDAGEVTWDEYLGVDPRDLGLRDGPGIALIFGDGTIVQAAGGRGARARLLEADAVERALEDAVEDEEIRAIVLRINSGGGSALASDQVWRQIQEVRKEKPVVISMGNAAASGGYYIASGADAIVAQPATMTGSIGVFFLHPALAGLFRKLEIGSEVITRGQYAAISISDAPFTKEQRERTREFVRSFYEGFLERVATGRGISVEEVDRVGQGRVWLGETAMGNGLVDHLGGLRKAVTLAQSEAGLDPDVDPRRVIFPGPRPLAEQIAEVLRGELHDWFLGHLQLVRLPEIVQSLSLLAEGELAYLPPYWVEIH
jgi:protease-4